MRVCTDCPGAVPLQNPLLFLPSSSPSIPLTRMSLPFSRSLLSPTPCPSIVSLNMNKSVLSIPTGTYVI
ncbi:MAG: hypothetical protein ACK55Z_37810, partial [bacterium]